MKKYAILLLAGSMITLASCGDDSNTTTQEQIDSAATARTMEMEAQLKAQNDSLINAMAMMKADSAARADSMARTSVNSTTTTRTTTTTTKTTKVPVRDIKSGGLGSQSDASNVRDKKSIEGGGLGSQADQKQKLNKKSVEGGGLGSQADK